ncbi:MLO-like protein 12 isoform X2 [Glycine soja]|uniref:MLO-like protein n=1 Tax=Glycine soja TaxID=3848 RepID=A0A445KFE9_GLYSO|nr:MLO-like protein 12 isoform X2 [Glycine soja]RZC09584.1 MLO-like protein 12 isoform B [Glycine soja]
MDIGKERSLEETPTWAVSVFCFFFLMISLIIEGGLHKLAEIFRKRKEKSLGKALTKTKTVPISKICISKGVANSFLPCKDVVDFTGSATRTSTSGLDVAPATNESAIEVNYCEAKGMVSLISSDGILQLNIFISFLAVFHILFCTLTMCLGKAKMRRWKRWEDETQTLEYQIANDPRRFQYTGQTLIGKRHLKFWSYHSPLLWMVCFIRQFYASVSKDDYFTLRNGFIAANISLGSNFNFKKFLSRTYDEDFEKVMGIRIWIWIFSILFIFFSAHEFYNYYWLPFIPLVVALLAGTKLQVIITKMCVDSCKEKSVIKGSLLVTPSDAHFWFHRPEWLLHLLKFILIQNSFQLAFFTWTWYEFGPRSCFNRKREDIGIRIVMGVAVQLFCGYVTLPLYALVTQMGSSMRREIFTERVSRDLKNWHKRAKQSVSKNNSTSSKHSDTLHSKECDNSVRGSVDIVHTSDNVVLTSPPSHMISGEEEKSIAPTNEQEISSNSTSEIIKTTQEENPKIITRGTYDGEISFGSSWKNVGSSRGIGEIGSIIEEDDAEKLPELIP